MGLWGICEVIAVGEEGGGLFYESVWRVFVFFFFSSFLRNLHLFERVIRATISFIICPKVE